MDALNKQTGLLKGKGKTCQGAAINKKNQRESSPKNKNANVSILEKAFPSPPMLTLDSSWNPWRTLD